jgi:DnaK suppressor protein
VKAKPAKPHKPAAKQVTKTVAKTVAKSAPKAGSARKTLTLKNVVKKPVAGKPVARPGAKPVVKGKGPAKPASRPATKSGTKAVPKPAPKASPKPAGKPIAKLPAKPTKPMGKPAAKAQVKHAPAKPLLAPKATVPASAAPVAAPAVPAVPPKTTRQSARLLAITVPSMAPAVASTAAKSSFTKIAEPLVKPPLIVSHKKDPKLANNWKTKAAEQLTDAELMAMPDSEYMNDKQMAVFRLKLQVLKQDILSSAGETTEHLREDTVIVPDPADRATIEEEHALELRTRDRERKLLKKIEQSIQRIDAGDYGYCDETGEAIGVARLLARPTATLSLEAQQRRELKQKMFGD